MKRVFVIAAIVTGLTATGCGNQDTSSTNSPTPPDSAVSNGTEGKNPTDTGMGTINNGTPNNNMDTAKNKSNTMSDSSTTNNSGKKHK